MKRIIIMACFCLLCVMVSCKKAEEEKDEIPEMELITGCDYAPAGYYNEICVIEGCLYYCDPDRDAALYAYNMETKEEVRVTKLRGKLYNTQRGYFYLSGDFVYRLDGLKVTPFCELPEDGDFIGFFENKIIWTQRERYTVMREDGTSLKWFYRQSIWWQETEKSESVVRISTEDSEQLYYIPQEQGHLGTIETTEDGIYFEQNMEIATYSVIYYLPYETKEVKQVMEGELRNVLFYNEETVLILAEGDTGPKYLFRFNPITQDIQKLKNSKLVGFALLQDGKVYYDGEDGEIRCYTITDDTYEVSSNKKGGRVDFSEAALYKNYLILRHGYGYTFYVLDLETGEIKQVSD